MRFILFPHSTARNMLSANRPTSPAAFICRNDWREFHQSPLWSYQLRRLSHLSFHSVLFNKKNKIPWAKVFGLRGIAWNAVSCVFRLRCQMSMARPFRLFPRLSSSKMICTIAAFYVNRLLLCNSLNNKSVASPTSRCSRCVSCVECIVAPFLSFRWCIMPCKTCMRDALSSYYRLQFTVICFDKTERE